MPWPVMQWDIFFNVSAIHAFGTMKLLEVLSIFSYMYSSK